MLSIMRGIPTGKMETQWPLKQGQQCVAMGTDEAIRSRVYCYGSLFSVSKLVGNGKVTSMKIPAGSDFDSLSGFLNEGMPIVMFASNFKEGPSGQKNSQWAKSGFLPEHGHVTGCLVLK